MCNNSPTRYAGHPPRRGGLIGCTKGRPYDCFAMEYHERFVVHGNKYAVGAPLAAPENGKCWRTSRSRGKGQRLGIPHPSLEKTIMVFSKATFPRGESFGDLRTKKEFEGAGWNDNRGW